MSSTDLTLIVERLQNVGEDFSMDTSDLRSLVVKGVILCLKYVSRERVFQGLYPDGFADWGLDRGMQYPRGGNLLGDHQFWIPLLRLLSWPEPERPEATHVRLQFLRKQMRKCNVDVGGHSLVCRMFLAQLLESVSALQMFELMTCEVLKRDTHQSCALLLAALADNPSPPQECERVLTHLLGETLKVDTEALGLCLAAAQRQRASRVHGLRLKQMTSYVGRPRLRDRLQPSAEETQALDTVLGTWESYIGFCQVHQFPNVLSDIVKQRLYFLAAQTTWDWQQYTALVIHHHGALAERLAQYPVSKPDLHIIGGVMESLSMDGRPPFQELIAFRSKCFRSFPVSQVQRMTLSQVLRLYACAYQSPAIWKHLWKAQSCLISPLIIKDVEAFVLSTPFAADPFMQLMCGGAK